MARGRQLLAVPAAGWPARRALLELKSAAGVLDFSDLLAKARDLIKANTGVRHLQRAFTGSPSTSFRTPIRFRPRSPGSRRQPAPSCSMGDQTAIYSSAGPTSRRMARARRIRRQGGRTLQLTTSYRSPADSAIVNAFERHMIENPDTPGGLCSPAESPRTTVTAGDRALVPKPTGGSFSGPESVEEAIEDSLPDAIGAFIAGPEPDRGWTGRAGPTAPSGACRSRRGILRFSSADSSASVKT